MKNTLLILVALIGLCGSARAQVATYAQPEFIVAPHSLTCSSTTISATAPQELTGNTTAPASVPVYELMIMTLSTNATGYFSDSASVTTSTATNTGVPAYPFMGGGNAQPPFIPFLVGRTQKFYGIAGTAGLAVIVCKKK